MYFGEEEERKARLLEEKVEHVGPMLNDRTV